MRTTKILKILMIQKYPVQVEELSERFGVTTRTIRADIKEINDYLYDNDFPLIQTVRRKGIKLELTTDQKLQLNEYVNKISIEYYSNSELRILNLILEFTVGDLRYIYEKQEEFQVSKSTLDNDMRTVRQILNEYHLSINTSTLDSRILIKGSERTIRVMLFNIINKYLGSIDIHDEVKITTSFYQVLFQFIPLEFFERVYDLYGQYVEFNDAMYKNQTVLFLLIWVFRIKTGFELAEVTENEVSEEILSESNNIGLLIQELKEFFNIKVNYLELKYIRLILETLGTQAVSDPSKWTRGQIVTLNLMNYVQTELDLEFQNIEELFSGLFKHIVKLNSRLENNMQIRNPLTEEIKKNNPKIFSAIQNFTVNLNEELYNQITDDEIAFIAIYFLVGISKVRQSDNYLFKAVVFCNHGKATGKLLSQMLEENFDINVVEVLSTNEYDLLGQLDADIAFSTIPLELESLPILVVDSLLIEQTHEKVKRFLSLHHNRRRKISDQALVKETNAHLFEDILKVVKFSGGNVNEQTYNQLKNIFNKYNIKMNEDTALPNMGNLLKDKYILFDLKANDWKEAIEQTAIPLLNDGVINQEYIESMVNALYLNGPYIVIAPHIALAHAKPEDGVNEIGLSVSRLERPIEFGHPEHDPVSLIFNIAPIDAYRHINIMKDIFNIISNDNQIKELIEIDNKEEFIEILLKRR